MAGDKIRKIFIGGCIASGKSTLAKKLSQKFKIPLLEVDLLVYKDSGDKFKEEETILKLEKFLSENDSWIIEGTQKRVWCHKIFQLADISIILDIPWYICIKRFLLRQLKGLFDGSYQKYNNLQKIKWIKDFRHDDLKEYEFVLRLINANYIVLQNRKQINYFLNKLVRRGYINSN